MTAVRVQAIYAYHIIYRAISKPYIPKQCIISTAHFTNPGVLRMELMPNSGCIDEDRFLSAADHTLRTLVYPDFIWDTRCYKAYVRASLDSLGDGPQPNPCFCYKDVCIGNILMDDVDIYNDEAMREDDDGPYLAR